MRSIQTYARVAGALFLISMVAGFFGELYAPSHVIVSGDAAATAKNIIAHSLLFRAGFASYLIEALCDIALSLVMYELLRPVRKDLALLAAFFGLVSTAVFAVAELFYFGSSLIVGGAGYLKTFSPDQLNSLGLLSLKMYVLGGAIFMVFYGTATLLRGYLIYRSGFLPKALGALLAIAGIGFIVSNFVVVLAPAYASDLLLLPMFLAGLSMTVWLLVKGVDVRQWEARAGNIA
jgi:hypothetical protein